MKPRTTLEIVKEEAKTGAIIGAEVKEEEKMQLRSLKSTEKSNEQLELNVLHAIRKNGDVRAAIDELIEKRDYMKDLATKDSKGNYKTPNLEAKIPLSKVNFGHEGKRYLLLVNEAVNYERTDALKMLIHEGVNINLSNFLGEWDHESQTPLTIAAMRDNTECMTILLKNNAKIDLKNQFGDTALSMAVRHGHEKSVKLLIDNKANVNLKNGSGNTPLMLAVKSGNQDCVQLLLEAHANIHAKNGYLGFFGKTALQIAAEQDPPVCALKLIVAQNTEKSSRKM